MPISKLKKQPKSKILKKGYINIYSELNPSEFRQIYYNCEYKKINPKWDNTLVSLCNKLKDRDNLVVLDAGCGNGNYIIDEFRTKINWACGVDLKPKFTRENICLDEIKYSNLASLPYPDNKFDIVFSLWVIEHLRNPREVFKEIYRVLKPGGSFLFATPNKQSWLILLKRLIGNEDINLFINRNLFGRDKIDIFPTYYKANDINNLGKLLKIIGFTDINLKLNYDPGYTSFNTLTFYLSNLLDKIFGYFLPSFYKQHIIGSARK